MLGPVSKEDEGAGSGTRFMRALSLVTCVCAGAGAEVCGGVVVLSRLHGGGLQFSSRHKPPRHGQWGPGGVGGWGGRGGGQSKMFLHFWGIFEFPISF